MPQYYSVESQCHEVGVRIKQILFKYAILALSLFIITACVSDAKEASCGPTEDFNPVFRQCVPKSLGASIQITSFTPTLSYTVSKTSTEFVVHTIEVLDPFNQGYVTEWFLYSLGNPADLVASATDTYQYLPSSLAVGTYSLEAVVKDIDRVRVLDKATWSIVISSNNAPKIVNPVPTTTVVNLQTSDPVSRFQVDVDNSNSAENYTIQFSLNGVLVGSAQTISASPGTYNFFYDYDPSTVSTPGTQTIDALIKSSAGVTEEIHTWAVVVTNPDLPKLSAQEVPVAATITAIDGVTIGADGFLYNDLPISLCVQTDDFDGTQNDNTPGTHIQFFIANTTTGAKVPISAEADFPASNTDVCLRNISGTYAINLTNPQIPETKNIIVEMTDKQTGVISDTRDWQVVIRPKNTPPIITANTPANTSVITIEQDAVQNYLFDTFDEDSVDAGGNPDPEQFETEFFLNGVSVCLKPRLNGDSITQKFSCDVAVPSYGTSGPVPPSANNTLLAVTRDTAVAAWGGNNLESNQLAWSITTTEAQTAPVVLPAPASFIALTASPASPITAAIEGDEVRFNIVIQDAERDHLLITLQKCNTMTAGCSNLVTQESFLKTDGNINSVWTKDIVLSQDTLIGAANGLVYFNVIVEDQPDTVASLTGELAPADRLVLNMINVNPAPVITGNTNPDHTSIIPLRVVAGIPASFDPGTVTDASITDGDTILYQWRISSDNVTYNDISGANGQFKKVLTWTPPAEAVADGTHYLRVCIGDDGFGNDPAACAQSLTWMVEPVSNLVVHTGALPSAIAGETASWFDTDLNSLFTVYSVGTAPSVRLNVVQTLYNADGSTTESSFFFPSGDEVAGLPNSYEVADLSIVGETSNPLRRNLYISYIEKTPAPGGAGGTNDYLRIRRVDITDDNRFGYSYDGLVIDDPDLSCFTRTFNPGVTPAIGTTDLTVLGGCQYGDAIEVNGVPFEFVGSAGAPVATGVNRVVVPLGPSDVVAATALADAINAQNSDPRLAAITTPVVVTRVGAVITFDHDNIYRDLNDNEVSGSRIMDRIGSIMIHNPGTPSWYLPVLDNPTGSKVLFVSSQADGSIESRPIVLTPAPTTQEANEIVNRYNPVRQAFDIAIKSNAGAVYGYHFTPGSGAPSGTLNDIFGVGSISNIRIASEKPNNPYVFVTGLDTAKTSDPLALARIDSSVFATALGACPSGCAVEEEINDDGTNLGLDIVDYQINSSTQNEEAILAIISGGANGNKAFIAKVDDPTPVIRSTMAPVMLTADVANTAAGISVHATDLIDINNDTTGITLGSAGSIPSQNTVNGFFFSYFKPLSPLAPETAFININNETTISTDANSEVFGYMLPYIQ